MGGLENLCYLDDPPVVFCGARLWALRALENPNQAAALAFFAMSLVALAACVILKLRSASYRKRKLAERLFLACLTASIVVGATTLGFEKLLAFGVLVILPSTVLLTLIFWVFKDYFDY